MVAVAVRLKEFTLDMCLTVTNVCSPTVAGQAAPTASGDLCALQPKRDKDHGPKRDKDHGRGVRIASSHGLKTRQKLKKVHRK
jgi:hypothetical protein